MKTTTTQPTIGCPKYPMTETMSGFSSSQAPCAVCRPRRKWSARPAWHKPRAAAASRTPPAPAPHDSAGADDTHPAGPGSAPARAPAARGPERAARGSAPAAPASMHRPDSPSPRSLSIQTGRPLPWSFFVTRLAPILPLQVMTSRCLSFPPLPLLLAVFCGACAATTAPAPAPVARRRRPRCFAARDRRPGRPIHAALRRQGHDRLGAGARFQVARRGRRAGRAPGSAGRRGGESWLSPTRTTATSCCAYATGSRPAATAASSCAIRCRARCAWPPPMVARGRGGRGTR